MKKGFTLVELLIVIAILCILLVIAIPIIKNSTESDPVYSDRIETKKEVKKKPCK